MALVTSCTCSTPPQILVEENRVRGALSQVRVLLFFLFSCCLHLLIRTSRFSVLHGSVYQSELTPQKHPRPCRDVHHHLHSGNKKRFRSSPKAHVAFDSSSPHSRWGKKTLSITNEPACRSWSITTCDGCTLCFMNPAHSPLFSLFSFFYICSCLVVHGYPSHSRYVSSNQVWSTLVLSIPLTHIALFAFFFLE